MSTNYVKIFDTTLRDGEQSPGASLTSVEKLEIARQLARLGVDVIEAGFPAASPDDLAAVQRIAREVGQSADPGRARADHRRASPGPTGRTSTSAGRRCSPRGTRASTRSSPPATSTCSTS